MSCSVTGENTLSPYLINEPARFHKPITDCALAMEMFRPALPDKLSIFSQVKSFIHAGRERNLTGNLLRIVNSHPAVPVLSNELTSSIMSDLSTSCSLRNARDCRISASVGTSSGRLEFVSVMGRGVRVSCVLFCVGMGAKEPWGGLEKERMSVGASAIILEMEKERHSV